MSSRRGLPDFRKMRHDRHFVEELASKSVVGVGVMLPVSQIETNREQPRTNLGDLSELTESIRQRGVLEPLLVRKVASGRYQLVAGERRFHAAVAAGLTEVPCVEMSLSDQEALEVALVENLQRRDLNPFEEAEGYRTLVEKYGYTHEQVAQAVGKSRTSITETLSLLNIPPAIRDLCRHADITAKSKLLIIARAKSIDEMERLVQAVLEEGADREALRALQGKEAKQPESSEPTPAPPGFRPIQLRYRPSPTAPIRVSLTVARPGVSKEEILQALEDLISKLRSGEFDQRLGNR
ncbi:MAG: chromosome partitioning protein ParB [Thermoanaerobaculum sp.]|nr:MAG: chromosome partitioning protein ParB [Thermoanaerobaculum sp.]GBC80254.1 Chromosome-partitioning protein Spo0J [bacterium HR09]